MLDPETQASAPNQADARALTAVVCALGSIEPRLSGMSFEELDQVRTGELSDDAYLDYLAWVAVAIARAEQIGQLSSVWESIGAPTALTAPAFYPDPMYNTGYRWHDGTDWTDRCWTKMSSGKINESSRPLSLEQFRQS